MIKLKDIISLLIIRKNKWKLRFLCLWWWTDRKKSMIKILKESLQDIKNFSPVVINPWDRPINKYIRLNVFSYSTGEWYYDKIIPDWTYDAWIECGIPEFNKITKEIENAWYEKPLVNKIGWIWNFKTSPSRLVLAKLWDDYPQYLDIKDSNNTQYITLPDLVKTYSCLIDVEWYWFSWRLKYLFFSWRPVFVQERTLKEYALIWAIPNVDYIPVKNDFSNLIEKFEQLDPKEVEKIWQNWKNFAIKNLNKEMAYEYIHNEFLDLKKTKIKFNNCKIILFIFIILINRLYWKMVGLVYFITKNIKRKKII